MYKCEYFKIYELVSEKVYNKYGERAWQFFDPNLLMTLDDLRRHFKSPIIVNTWKNGGGFSQRGLRANLDPIVASKTKRGKLYVSEHILGRAIDFDVKGLTAEEVRQEIIKNSDKFTYIRRMEKDVNWVHIDLKPSDFDGIYLF